MSSSASIWLGNNLERSTTSTTFLPDDNVIHHRNDIAVQHRSAPLFEASGIALWLCGRNMAHLGQRKHNSQQRSGRCFRAENASDALDETTGCGGHIGNTFPNLGVVQRSYRVNSPAGMILTERCRYGGRHCLREAHRPRPCIRTDPKKLEHRTGRRRLRRAGF